MLHSKLRNPLYGCDSTNEESSFLDAAPCIAENDYVPIEADVLHAKVADTGIVETQLEMGALS